MDRRQSKRCSDVCPLGIGGCACFRILLPAVRSVILGAFGEMANGKRMAGGVSEPVCVLRSSAGDLHAGVASIASAVPSRDDGLRDRDLLRCVRCLYRLVFQIAGRLVRSGS